MPLIMLIYLLFKFKSFPKNIIIAAVFVLGVFVTLLPWSIFASVKSGHLVFLTTPDVLIFDSNNEDALKSGFWEPAWRKQNAQDQKYLYNRLLDSHYSGSQKLLMFYSQNSSELPGFFRKKLVNMYAYNKLLVRPVFGGMFLFYLFYLFDRFRTGRRRTAKENIPFFPLMFFINLVLMALMIHGNKRYTEVYLPFFILPAIYAPFYLIKKWKLFLPQKRAA
jgi:4-amino-4-deoxy-L-arabinose transferase-like glycosyltransferase